MQTGRAFAKATGNRCLRHRTSSPPIGEYISAAIRGRANQLSRAAGAGTSFVAYIKNFAAGDDTAGDFVRDPSDDRDLPDAENWRQLELYLPTPKSWQGSGCGWRTRSHGGSGAANAEIGFAARHEQGLRKNGRDEDSRQPTRRRELKDAAPQIA